MYNILGEDQRERPIYHTLKTVLQISQTYFVRYIHNTHALCMYGVDLTKLKTTALAQISVNSLRLQK